MADEELDEHRKELEAAINQSLTDSPEVSRLIQKMRDRGYDVFLIIEATVGFSKRSESEGEGEPQMKETPSLRLNLTSQDERFLRSLKIKPT